jgi:hypothetical protein
MPEPEIELPKHVRPGGAEERVEDRQEEPRREAIIRYGRAARRRPAVTRITSSRTKSTASWSGLPMTRPAAASAARRRAGHRVQAGEAAPRRGLARLPVRTDRCAPAPTARPAAQVRRRRCRRGRSSGLPSGNGDEDVRARPRAVREASGQVLQQRRQVGRPVDGRTSSFDSGAPGCVAKAAPAAEAPPIGGREGRIRSPSTLTKTRWPVRGRGWPATRVGSAASGVAAMTAQPRGGDAR